MKAQSPGASRLLAAGLICAMSVAVPGFNAETRSNAESPVVRVLSPPGAAHLMDVGQESRAMVVLEVVESKGSQVVTDDSGLPRFQEANKNVGLFVKYLVARGSYVTGQLQRVTQLTSMIPVAKLVTGEWKMTPPTDWDSLVEDEGVMVPPESMLDAAEFIFKVKDQSGQESKPAVLVVAVAKDVFRGPLLPEPPHLQRRDQPGGADPDADPESSAQVDPAP